MKFTRLFFWKSAESEEGMIESPSRKNFALALLVVMISFALFIRLTETTHAPYAEQKSTPAVSQTHSPTLSFGSTTISLILANTDTLRERGLSGRTGLPEATGMLFEFETDSYPAIWMKDMLFSLDIIWLDKDFRIVEIAENISPETFPKIFSPRALSRYVLEVPAGFSKQHSLTPGLKANFLR